MLSIFMKSEKDIIFWSKIKAVALPYLMTVVTARTLQKHVFFLFNRSFLLKVRQSGIENYKFMGGQCEAKKGK